jgi:hypothetical protein
MCLQLTFQSSFQELLEQWRQHTLLPQQRLSILDPRCSLLFKCFKIE